LIQGAVPARPTTLRQLMAHFDHTLVRPDLTASEVRAGVLLAARLQTATAIVRQWEVRSVVSLVDKPTVIGTSIGFPHGGVTTRTKVSETVEAFEDGAGEVDVVMNIGAFLSGDVAYVARELQQVVRAAEGHPVKVIIETGFLPIERVLEAAHLAADAGATFVKNGTGYSPRGATVEETRMLRDSLPASVGVKAAGGIKTLDQVLALLEAGAQRIGASATEAIAREWEASQQR